CLGGAGRLALRQQPGGRGHHGRGSVRFDLAQAVGGTAAHFGVGILRERQELRDGARTALDEGLRRSFASSERPPAKLPDGASDPTGANLLFKIIGRSEDYTLKSAPPRQRSSRRAVLRVEVADRNHPGCRQGSVAPLRRASPP